MLFRLLADIVVIIHGLFIIYALLGSLWYFYRRYLIWLHIPAAIWIGIVEINHWICPLTPLENYLRFRGNEAGYKGGFVEHYILPVIYPVDLTPEFQVILGGLAFSLNALLYTIIIYHYIKHRRQTQ